MSRVGKKAMGELRRRLRRGGQPDDVILLRRDLIEALVADAEQTQRNYQEEDST